MEQDQTQGRNKCTDLPQAWTATTTIKTSSHNVHKHSLAP